MEAAIHVPVSFWAIRALVGESGKVPLVLFAYALQTVITTATCMYDFSQWEGVAVEAKWHLASLYGPYLLIGEFGLFVISSLGNMVGCEMRGARLTGIATYMAVDMWGRLSADLKELSVLRAGKKGN